MDVTGTPGTPELKYTGTGTRRTVPLTQCSLRNTISAEAAVGGKAAQCSGRGPADRRSDRRADCERCICVSTQDLVFWPMGRALQWLAGRGFHEFSDGLWCSAFPYFSIDICERFWRKYGSDSEAEITHDMRWAVVRTFVELSGIQSALVLDPLGGVRDKLRRGTPEYRRHVREFRSVYFGCASDEFNGGVWVSGPSLLSVLRHQCHVWMRMHSGSRNSSIVFPSNNAQLCFCHHGGTHLCATSEDVVLLFQKACNQVIGKSASVERVE